MKNQQSNSTEASQSPQSGGFQFKTVKEMYDAPREAVRFIVDGLLPASGVSLLAGKPKSGKTTVARQLAVAVAKGQDFLGRSTEQGTVLYLGIEEKYSEVRSHFEQLGLVESDSLLASCGAIDRANAIFLLEASLRQNDNVRLVVIDPMFRFLNIKDGNDYISVNDALESLMEVARKHGTHIVVVHHVKKRQSDDVVDGALGSTAIVGGVDTFISLRSIPSGVRTFQTQQRYGESMPETQLTWNAKNRSVDLGQTTDEAEREEAVTYKLRIQSEIIAYVTGHPECTQEAVLKIVKGKTATKKRMFQELSDAGIFLRSGNGVKQSPFTYKMAPPPTESVPDSLPPAPVLSPQLQGVAMIGVRA